MSLARSPRRMEAGLYASSLRSGVELLRAGRPGRALRYLVRPVSYWRSLEFRLVWEYGDFNPSDRVLDVGSPKPFALYLAGSVGAEVYATDIEGYFVDEYTRLREARGLPAERLRIETADGRSLPYPSAHFSKVYSVSVLEHIPGEGDSECARELGRVLTPGGACLITVPFWPTSRDIYRDGRSFYWAGSSQAAGDGRVFFQRRYSEPDLQRRLVGPSGLRLERLLFVGERVMKGRDSELSDYLPPASGLLDPVLSRLVHTSPVEDWRRLGKPLCAFLKLVKPA